MVKTLYLDKMIYVAADIVWTRGAGGWLSCAEGWEGLWPANGQSKTVESCRSKTVTAGFLPEDTILWGLQVESLAAKEKVVKIFMCKSYMLIAA